MIGECPQAHRLGRVARSDDPDRPGALSGSQGLPPRDERAEDLFGERGPKAHQTTELRLLDDEYATRSADTAGQEAALAGQEGQLAHERARSERDEDDLVVPVGAHDLGFTLEDHEQVIRRLAGSEKDLPGRDGFLETEGG